MKNFCILLFFFTKVFANPVIDLFEERINEVASFFQKKGQRMLVGLHPLSLEEFFTIGRKEKFEKVVFIYFTSGSDLHQVCLEKNHFLSIKEIAICAKKHGYYIDHIDQRYELLTFKSRKTLDEFCMKLFKASVIDRFSEPFRIDSRYCYIRLVKK